MARPSSKKPFEARIEATKGYAWAESFKDAAVNVNDSIENAILIAKQNFGPSVKTADVFEICRLILEENARIQDGKP